MCVRVSHPSQQETLTCHGFFLAFWVGFEVLKYITPFTTVDKTSVLDTTQMISAYLTSLHIEFYFEPHRRKNKND